VILAPYLQTLLVVVIFKGIFSSKKSWKELEIVGEARNIWREAIMTFGVSFPKSLTWQVPEQKLFLL
jgi:nucleoside recognition membrane protein YjiH